MVLDTVDTWTRLLGIAWCVLMGGCFLFLVGCRVWDWITRKRKR